MRRHAASEVSRWVLLTILSLCTWAMPNVGRESAGENDPPPIHKETIEDLASHGRVQRLIHRRLHFVCGPTGIVAQGAVTTGNSRVSARPYHHSLPNGTLAPLRC
jgi:hypothetical protein